MSKSSIEDYPNHDENHEQKNLNLNRKHSNPMKILKTGEKGCLQKCGKSWMKQIHEQSFEQRKVVTIGLGLLVFLSIHCLPQYPAQFLL